ncbi:MAG: acetamidase/formamidase family protein [Chloroflexota bacterium]
MHRLPATRSHGAFRPDIPPALRVRPGEIVTFETTAEPVERLFAAGDRWLEVLDVDAVNVVTGPVYIEGVAPGDAVSVEILDVTPGPWGWNASIPGFGPLSKHLGAPALCRLPISEGWIALSDRLRAPVRPMIGCLGLAPASGESSTLSPPWPWGGNYDLTQVRPGATVLLPAQVPGGLFSLGDLHAAMGENEATSVSIECPGAATVRLGIRKGLRLQTPRIEHADRIFTIGVRPKDQFPDAREEALDRMWEYLTGEAGCTPDEAYRLCSAVVDVHLGGPAGMVVLASIERRWLPGG